MFIFKQQIMEHTGNVGTKVVSTIVPLKYVSIFWITLKMPLTVKLVFSWNGSKVLF